VRAADARWTSSAFRRAWTHGGGLISPAKGCRGVVELIEIGIALALFFGGLGVALLVYSRRYVKVPPNQAYVVYGGRRGGSEGFRVVTGRGLFLRPIVDSYKVLSLEPVQVVVGWDLLTKDRREVRAAGLGNGAVGRRKESMEAAAQQLLGKHAEEG